MPHTIWKFTLRPDEPVMMPEGAKVLSAHGQGDDVCLWAEVDPAAPKEPRRFAVFGTGHDLPEAPGEFVGTAMIFGGRLVFHVYDSNH